MSKYIYFTENLLQTIGVFDFGVRWSGAVKMILSTILVGTFFATGFYDLIYTDNDFSQFAENVSLLLVGAIALVKYYTLFYSRDKMKYLRDVIKLGNLSGEELNSEDQAILDDFNAIGLNFCKNYGWIIFIICEAFVLQTAPGMILGNGLLLPFPAVYPFYVNSTGLFAIAYIHQALGTHMYLIMYLTFDTWFILLIHYTCGHFCLLQNFLEKIADTDQHPSDINERIARCVRLHQKIYKFSDELEDIFNMSNLIQFLSSTVAMCISGYEAVDVGFEKPQILVKHVSSVYGQAVQLLIFNWCGQLMEEKSLGVSHAISRANLYKLKVDHQRDLSLILLRAQKPTYITAGKFSNLSLLNFSNLMQASMSYFTMLTSVQEN